MGEQTMQLWGVRSISKGTEHYAIVREVNLAKAIALYCSTFCGIAEHIVTIQCNALKLDHRDDFGKLLPGAASIVPFMQRKYD